MYAVVQAGGKQYRVSPGEVMIVNRLSGETGDRVDLSNVLMLDDGKKLRVGNPFLGKTAIQAEILEQKRDKKIIVFKKKRRKGYRRKHGHRQHLTVLRVLDFEGGGVIPKTQMATKPKKAEEVTSTEKAVVKKTIVQPTTKASATSKKVSKTTTAKSTKAKKVAAPKKAAAPKKESATAKPKASPKEKKVKEE